MTLLFPVGAHAVVLGGSNLGFGAYPSHDCIAPDKPNRPYSFSSEWERDSYNSQVDDYNSQLRQYSNCVDEYIENATNDIERIKEKAQEAIDEASASRMR